MDDAGLYDFAQAPESLVKALAGVDLVVLSLLLQERNQGGGSFMELLNFLGENARGNVVGVILAQSNHALLADILGALEGENFRWSGAVLDEVLGLVDVLGEVLDEHSRGGLYDHLLDEFSCDHIIIFSSQALLLNEVVEVHKLHVGPLGQCLSKGALARGLWSQKEGDRGKHSPLSLLINIMDLLGGVDSPDLAELLVQVDDWLRLFVIILESLEKSLLLIVISSTGLCSLHASLEHDLVADFVEKNVLGFADILFKVNCLLDLSGEAINQNIL